MDPKAYGKRNPETEMEVINLSGEPPEMAISYYWGIGANIREGFVLRLTMEEAVTLRDRIDTWITSKTR